MEENKDETKQKELREGYHEAMAEDLAYHVLIHFNKVKGYVPYGYLGHCKEKLRAVIDELMDHEGEL